MLRGSGVCEVWGKCLRLRIAMLFYSYIFFIYSRGSISRLNLVVFDNEN